MNGNSMNSDALDGETFGLTAIRQAHELAVITNEMAGMPALSAYHEVVLSQGDQPRLRANISGIECRVGELTIGLAQNTVLLAKARSAHKLAQEASAGCEEPFLQPRLSAPLDTRTRRQLDARPSQYRNNSGGK
jgi:hypothetical protein